MGRRRARRRYHFQVTTLVHQTPSDHDDPDGLRAQVAELEALLDQRAADFARVKTELATFRLQYRQEVGVLHDQLDELELAIAEAELGEAVKRQQERGDAPGAQSSEVKSAPPRFTTDDVRKLFRDVAKAIHPDLAGDASARERRHALMIEANRAYAAGDEAHLRWILQQWERSPEAVTGSDVEALRMRLERRLDQAEEQLELLASELAALRDTPLWKLKAKVDEAAAKGKDLVGDMVRRLKRDIMVATNRLDAISPPER